MLRLVFYFHYYFFSSERENILQSFLLKFVGSLQGSSPLGVCVDWYFFFFFFLRGLWQGNYFCIRKMCRIFVRVSVCVWFPVNILKYLINRKLAGMKLPAYECINNWSSTSNLLIHCESEKSGINLPLGQIKSKLSASAQTASFCLWIIMGSFSCVCHQISPLLQMRRSQSAVLDSGGIQIRQSQFEVCKL